MKLKKFINEDRVATFQVDVEGTVQEAELDLNSLSDETKERLEDHGALAKIGDSAAGKDGEEALAAIVRVIDMLKEGKWTSRKRGSGKVTKASIMEQFNSLPAEEQERTKALLDKLLGN